MSVASAADVEADVVVLYGERVANVVNRASHPADATSRVRLNGHSRRKGYDAVEHDCREIGIRRIKVDGVTTAEEIRRQVEIGFETVFPGPEESDARPKVEVVLLRVTGKLPAGVGCDKHLSAGRCGR